MQQSAVTCAWRFWPRICIAAFAALAILTIGWETPLRAQGQFYYPTALYAFGTATNDGQSPHNGSLVRDASGDLFGATQFGGAHNEGTVYELVDSSGSYTEKILYSFQGGRSDGVDPIGGVILDSSGNLYGTTNYGGAYDLGTVFELINSSGTYTEKILYSFAGSPDGASPFAGLAMDSSGNLYGTTLGGGTGANHSGTVFELLNSASTYSEKILYSFSTTDGTVPFAGVILDAAGNLYGATGGAGPNITGAGSVFELVNSSGTYTEKVLYSFTGGSDGASPVASLIVDSSDNLYGTTQNGGDFGNSSVGLGTVFELVNSSGTYTERILHTFTGASDGADPTGNLIMDSSGNLFGTTVQGPIVGASLGSGTVFELVNSSGTYSEKVLHDVSYCVNDGLYPYAGLVMDPSGNLFGTTSASGGNTQNPPTVFELVSDSIGSALPTTTAITSSAGQDANVTATVTSAFPTAPTGFVTFSRDGTQLAAETLSCGTAQYSGAVGIGTFTLTAKYIPDTPALFQPSSASMTETVTELGVATTDGNNTFNGNQTINGNVSATGTFTGNGSALTNVTALNLNCMGCVGNGQLGINYAGSLTQGGAANNALLFNGMPSSSFQPAGSYATTGTNSFVGDQTIGGNLTLSGPLAALSGILLPPFNTATSAQGFSSSTLDAAASVFNSNSGTARNQLFRWQAEPAANNTASPSATLNLLFGANGASPAETGLSINSSGIITFAPGQTFPASGVVAVATASPALSSGGTSPTVSSQARVGSIATGGGAAPAPEDVSDSATVNFVWDLFFRNGVGLGSNYTDWNNSWNPGGGAAYGSTNGGYYDVTAFTANVGGQAVSPTEYVKAAGVKQVNGPGGSYIGVGARINGTAGATTNVYSCIESNTTLYLVKAIYTTSSTTNNVMASTSITPLTDGDSLEEWVVGQTISCFQNRSSVPPGPFLQCNDTSYTSGPVGLVTEESTSGPNSTLSSLTVINATAPAGATANIVIDGGDDALTGGEPGSWADFLDAPISGANIFNASVDGKGLGTILPTGSSCGNIETMITTGTSVIDPLFVSGITNIVVVLGGAQDITNGGVSPSTVYGYLTTYVAARHAAGWKVVVVPLLSNSITNGYYDSQMQAYDQLLFANSAGADAIVQLPQTLIGPHAYLNTNLFSNVHPTILAQEIIAQQVSAAIKPLL